MTPADEERAAVVAMLRKLSRKNKSAEDNHARHGAYASSSEAANWRMGVEAAIEAVRRGDHRAPATGTGKEKG